MNAAFQASGPAPVAARTLMRPVTFEGLFGWLHDRGDGRGDTGVVLVSPLGRDARCAHLPMRLFADQLAAAGFPTLRYDHLGQGDSLDMPDVDGDALPLWRSGVERAIDQLRARTGVSRVVLGGVRLGASLANLADAHADGLILLAPVLNAKSWLRRLRFSTGALGGEGAGDEPGLDMDGLLLSAATCRGLAQIDLVTRPPAPRPTYIAAQNRLVADYATALASRGVPAAPSDFPGFDALFLDAHSNAPPFAVFDAATGWLKANFSSSKSSRRARRPSSGVALLRPPGAAERAVEFGVGLRGVLCEPDRPADGAPAVLFCNTGGDPHSGIGGFATTAARALALRGVASLRFDFAGLGDSAMPGAEVRSHVYDLPREDDFDAAAQLLAARGHRQLALAGVCAGAYHAFRFAMQDPRVTGLFAANPVHLTWRPNAAQGFTRRDDGKATRAYLQSLGAAMTWRRLLSSDLDLAAVTLTLLGRLKRRAIGLAMRFAPASPFRLLRGFTERGGRACFLMGLDDASLDEIETYFGPRGARLKTLPTVAIRIDPKVDHGLARSASRRLALDALLDALA